MSAAMIAATLWIPENKEPDWSAAEEALAKFTCPPDGFPEGHALKGSWLEDTLLADFEDDEATTDQDRKKIVDGTLAGTLRVVREAVEGERIDTTWIKNAGWVVYITGGLSNGDIPTDTAEAIHTISGTGILEAAGFFKKPDKVMAVVFESEYATTVDLVADEAAAEKVVADYCRQFWSKIVVTFDDGTPPEDDKTVIEQFFSDAPPSWWETRKWVSTADVAI